MKNKIKKLKLPLSKMTGNEKDYTAVLLEDVNSNMKAFWEVLSGTQGDVKDLKAGMEVLQDTVSDNGIEISELKNESMKTNKRLDSIESLQEVTNTRLDSIESLQEVTNTRLDSIDGKVDNINKEKVDPRRFLELEKKVINIESKIKVSAF